ncbi:MAG TPA: type II toxin-antitoxin system ParD family antitoxin [Dongiaceae bacterium]|nr:type II toxin-antitoxin system ParD family antitoxin [Dongiaceae bacterium]
MQISLPPKLEELVREKVESGRYSDASEVIRDALKLMQELDAVQGMKLERLREELAKGEADLAAGRKTVIANDDELSALFARL